MSAATTTAVAVDPQTALATVHAALDVLAAADLSRLSEPELLEFGRDAERLNRRLPTLDHAFILELETRGVPAAHACRSTGQFLRWLLRLDPAEAGARVHAAEATGTRTTLTGEVLTPAYPLVAAAQAAGELGARQARVIIDTVEKLPDAVRAEAHAEVEATMVEFAGQYDALILGRLARRIGAYYDPDGTLPDTEERERRRELTLHLRPDGSAHLTGELTAELAEYLHLTFNSLAAPKPETNGVKDPRGAGQRRHDALLEALNLAVRCEQLPTVTGIAATLVITMTERAYRTGTGLARTSSGALIPTAEALRWAGGDYRLLAVVLNHTRAITAYSSTHRLFTETQRLAMNARDGGCTFPTCDAPPGQCQAMHLTDYHITGHTRVDDGGLGCHYHHRENIKQGWQTRLINGRVAWIPPPWIDPTQTPLYNGLHRPLELP